MKASDSIIIFEGVVAVAFHRYVLSFALAKQHPARDLPNWALSVKVFETGAPNVRFEGFEWPRRWVDPYRAWRHRAEAVTTLKSDTCACQMMKS